MNLDQALQTFIAESRELLEDVETALLSIEQAEDRGESIAAIFRAAHTIKGSAGLFGLDHVVSFTHVAESVLDEVREGKVALDAGLVGLLLKCCDHIGSLVDGVDADAGNVDAALVAKGEPLLTQLKVYLGGKPQAGVPAEVAAPSFERIPAAGGGDHDHWHISLRFGPDVLRNGMDPLSFLRYLKKLGTITAIATLPDALPALAEMEAESCYLGFELALQSTADRAAIEGAFEFVQDDCAVRIVPPGSPVADYLDLLGAEGAQEMGEILVHCRSLTRAVLDAALAGATADAPSGEPPVAEVQAAGATAEAAAPRQRAAKDAKAGETQSVRVDADKLDRLVDLVGELITASATASVAGRHLQSTALQEAHSTLVSLVQEVRDSALQLRMVKIGATFSRFKRVVHDVSREIGKDIALEIHGEDTELDKTVVEKIADPLTHLVRNSMATASKTQRCAPSAASPRAARSRSTRTTTPAAS